MSISAKNKKIADNYLTNGYNKTQAYLQENPDAAYESARVTASRLFAKANFKEYIKKRFEEAAMTAEEAIARSARIASADVSSYIDKNGYLDFEAMKEDGLGFMYKGTQMSVDKDGGEHLTIQLHDTYKALQDILKIHGKFSQKSFNLDIDLNQLSDEALEQIANGEDPLKVLTNERATTSSSYPN